MKKVNVSTKYMNRFAGKWVAILGERVVAVGNTLQDIRPVVTRTSIDKKPDAQIAAAFKVPYKGEDLWIYHLAALPPS